MRIVSALAAATLASIAVLALPAAYAEFPQHNTPESRKASTAEEPPLAAARVSTPTSAQQAPITAARASTPASIPLKADSSNADYEYASDDAGWQLRQAKYVFENGSLVHAKDCPLAMRVASAK